MGKPNQAVSSSADAIERSECREPTAIMGCAMQGRPSHLRHVLALLLRGLALLQLLAQGGKWTRGRQLLLARLLQARRRSHR